MACRQLADFLENGNIVNSVNFPTVSMPRGGVQRLCLAHKNIPNVIASITSAISAEGINIENLSNGSRGEYAYTLVDVGTTVGEHTIEALGKVEGMIRVTVL